MKLLLRSVIAVLTVLLSMNTFAQHINQQKMEQVHIKEDPSTGKCAVIDKISVPANAIATFAEKAAYIGNVVRQQAGFIKYEIFQLKGDNGTLKIITVATWADRQYLDNAQLAVKEAMNKAGINMPSFLEKNGIVMERDIYIPVEE